MAEKQVSGTVNIFAKAGGEKGAIDVSIQTAIKIHSEAVQNCPTKAGQLKNSLMWKTKGENGGFNTQSKESAPEGHRLTTKDEEKVVYVGTNSDHWYPEFGTRYMAARPFLRPAVDAVRGASAQAIAKKWGVKAMEEEFKKRKVKKI